MDERYYISGDTFNQLYDVVGHQQVCDLCEEYINDKKNIGFLSVKYGLDPDITFILIGTVLGLYKIDDPTIIILKSSV